MLKKAGIVVATAAAGLLAVSPLAFAGESLQGPLPGATDATSLGLDQKDSEGLINVLGQPQRDRSPCSSATTTSVKVADRATHRRWRAPGACWATPMTERRHHPNSSRVCAQDNVGGDGPRPMRVDLTALLRTAPGSPGAVSFLPAYNDAGEGYAQW